MEIVEPLDHDAETRPLERERRARRRRASVCFFAAGIGFGTAIYLLRARFPSLAQPTRQVAFAALVLLMVLLFWLGARAEVEVSSLDERLSELRDAARARRRRPPRPE